MPYSHEEDDILDGLKILYWCTGIMIFLAIAFVVANVMKGQEEGITHRYYGTVQKIENCRSSKHSYTCDIITETDTYRMDVTDFPGEGVYIGDLLFVEYVKYQYQIKTKMCRNDYCVGNSITPWYIPAFDEKSKMFEK